MSRTISFDFETIGEWLFAFLRWTALLVLIWFAWTQIKQTRVSSACQGTTRVFWVDKAFGTAVDVIPGDPSCVRPAPQVKP